MSKAERVTEVSFKGVLAKLNKQKVITLEIVAIYLAVVITILVFFESLKNFFYAVLGYVALLIFLLIIIYTIFYVLYNFLVIFYELFIRKSNV
ncbi:MAG: hypothetical protein ACW981_14745 [Candidatus Hodarchaeales archaeon]